MAEPNKGRKEETKWMEFILTVIVGLIVMTAGGVNIYTLLIGGGIIAGSLLEVREIRLYISMRLSKTTTRQQQKIEKSRVSGSTIVQAGRDVHIYSQKPEARENRGQKNIMVSHLSRRVPGKVQVR